MEPEPPLKPMARLLLWDYDRVSWPYVVLCLAILAFLLLVPPEWLHDPMVVLR
jgi:hypothetical protein